MKENKDSYKGLSGVSRYRIRTMLIIALFWMIIDLIVVLLGDFQSIVYPVNTFLIRSLLVFAMSLIMGYLFIFTLRTAFRKFPLWLNFVLKSSVLLAGALVISFILNFSNNYFINNYSAYEAFHQFINESIRLKWLLQKTFYWILLFLVTQLYIEVNEKYSPGVFLDILIGKYFHPKVEHRIIMFIDLKDSTPTAERLGNVKYFFFIREFIYQLSMAIIENEGRIYQYVGDEIVVSWSASKKNVRNCLSAVIMSRKNLQRKSEKFRRKYNVIPEFRVGIHIGDVTVGEIGVIKRDLAMSGDTMNTAARIRGACNELNQKFIASKDFIDFSDLKEFQRESLGMVDLKGKAEEIELFALKI